MSEHLIKAITALQNSCEAGIRTDQKLLELIDTVITRVGLLEGRIKYLDERLTIVQNFITLKLEVEKHDAEMEHLFRREDG